MAAVEQRQNNSRRISLFGALLLTACLLMISCVQSNTSSNSQKVGSGTEVFTSLTSTGTAVMVLSAGSNAYGIKSIAYDDGVAKVTYPQIYDFIDPARERSINEIIKTTFLQTQVDPIRQESARAGSSISFLKMDYQVTLHTSDTMSILWEGYLKRTLEIPVVYTMTIDLRAASKLSLGDFVRVDPKLLSAMKSATGITNGAVGGSQVKRTALANEVRSEITWEQNHGNADLTLPGLISKDNQGSYVFFLTSRALIISVAASQEAGSYALVEVPGEHINRLDLKLNQPYDLIPEAVNHDGIMLWYPQVSGLRDKNREQSINNIIRDELLTTQVDPLENRCEKEGSTFTLQMPYQIMLRSPEILSILWMGTTSIYGSNYPERAADNVRGSFVYALTIDMSTGKVLNLANFTKIDDNLLEKVSQATNVTNDTIGNGFFNKAEMLDMVRISLENDKDLRSYNDNRSQILDGLKSGNNAYCVTSNSLIVSIPVANVGGYYALVEVPGGYSYGNYGSGPIDAINGKVK